MKTKLLIIGSVLLAGGAIAYGLHRRKHKKQKETGPEKSDGVTKTEEKVVAPADSTSKPATPTITDSRSPAMTLMDVIDPSKAMPLSQRVKGRVLRQRPPGSPMLGVAAVEDEFPLRLGSKGRRVERLQIWLLRNHGWTGKVTGLYDEKTDRLMRKFLKREALDEKMYHELEMEKPVHQQRPTR